MKPDFEKQEEIDKFLDKLDIDLAGEEELRETIRGFRDLKKLNKRVVIERDANKLFVAVEYREPGDEEIIRRDLHGHLFTPMVFADGVASNI